MDFGTIDDNYDFSSSKRPSNRIHENNVQFRPSIRMHQRFKEGTPIDATEQRRDWTNKHKKDLRES